MNQQDWVAASAVVQAGAAIIVGWFAGQQVVLRLRDRRERRRTAYAALFAEWWRIAAISDRWQRENLVRMAGAGALDPENLVPQEWVSLVQLLGEVSSGTAAIGALAYQSLLFAAADARRLTGDLARGNLTGPGACEIEECIRRSLAQAVDTLADALKSAPADVARHEFRVIDPHSDAGRRLQNYIRQANLDAAPDRRHTRRLGWLGTWISQRLTRVAVWFDPVEW